MKVFWVGRGERKEEEKEEEETGDGVGGVHSGESPGSVSWKFWKAVDELHSFVWGVIS